MTLVIGDQIDVNIAPRRDRETFEQSGAVK
jgi:hypothetical protein